MSQSVRCAVAVGLAAFALGILPAAGQERVKNEGRKVVIDAPATAYLKPEGARLIFVVTSTEMAGKSAREANDKQVKIVQDALAAVPLKKDAVEVRVLPASMNTLVYPPANPNGARAKGKRAQSIFYVTIREKNPQKLRDAVTRLAEAAVDNGATSPDAENSPRVFRLPRRLAGADEEPESVPGPTIEWLASASKEARRDAIRRAVSDAKADAQAVVGDEKLRVVETVVSQPDDSLLRIRLRGESRILDSGLIPLKIHVRITFAY
jgi:uncharacterized protein YggE